MSPENREPGEGLENSFRGGDPRLIDYEDRSERAYWCKALLVTEAELYGAVAAVGNSAQKVKDWLAATRRS